MPDQSRSHQGTEPRVTERPWRPADVFRARKRRAEERDDPPPLTLEEQLEAGVSKLYRKEIAILQRALHDIRNDRALASRPQYNANRTLVASIKRVGDQRNG